jgi:pyrimidine operon attenuation protein/uracil phosphoribosyltransferase
MAFEIWERSSEETELTFIGIQQGGLAVAHCLAAALREVSGIKVEVMPMRLDKRDPVRNPPKLDADLSRKSVVLVDDVANSGKTLFYALGPLTPFKLRSVLIAVLVDRKHKAFPITPDVVGHALSTTLQDHIEVEADGDKVLGAYLH